MVFELILKRKNVYHCMALGPDLFVLAFHLL